MTLLLSVAWRSTEPNAGRVDPWLCAPALRRVCRFEELTRPGHPTRTRCHNNLVQGRGPVKWVGGENQRDWRGSYRAGNAGGARYTPTQSVCRAVPRLAVRGAC